MRFFVLVITLVSAGILSSARADDGTKPPCSVDIVRELNVKTPMRDGAKLSTDIYRPAAPGRYPVVLVRTPYVKAVANYDAQACFWAAGGYAFAVQDVHGRGDSDGDFYPFEREAKDGHDTIEWLGVQSWSTGKVGMVGGSYLGWTQVYAATEPSRYLAAIVPTVTPPDPDRNFPVSLGVPMPAGGAWLAGLDGHANQKLDEALLVDAHEALPSREFDRVMGRDLKAWKDWIDNIGAKSYWEALGYQSKLAASKVPMLHVSGWYDDVLVGTTENYQLMTTGKNSPSNRQSMIIGPWTHSGRGKRRIADIDFGPQAEEDLDVVAKAWFDFWLKGDQADFDTRAPVRVFAMGRNTWINATQWPIEGTSFVKYYLRSNGKANSRHGDGRLERRPPRTETPDQFNYDPRNPIPYMSTESWHQVGGPDDFSAIEERSDMLVYTSDPLMKPLLVCGPVRMRVFASTSARDTDWTAKLLDVHPDGKAIRLADGIVRARFRNGHDTERLITPGKVEAYDIDLWSTCTEFAAGHRIRVEVASSAFGKFDRNLNTGGRLGHEVEPVVATQTIFHQKGLESHILLPIVADRP